MTKRFDWGRLTPGFWLQNYPTNWEWDAMLNRLLDEGHKIKEGNYTVTINGIEIWVSNYPFPMGIPTIPKRGFCLPSQHESA